MSTHTQPTLREKAKMLYVRILLRMLPFLSTNMRYLSHKVQDEIDYLDVGYTFMLEVKGAGLTSVCTKTERGTFRRVPLDEIAVDVEPGSGLASADADAVTVDYVIAFRSLDYAFQCFSGAKSLQDALAERAFTTRGPNNTGVSLTYMFTALLRSFFFWRRAYRNQPVASTR
ncbi:D-alanyl-D-alanine carboxypeptidase [Raoultibacter phocaeensis]|uniref:D-alanyl-D-alanine carboxypeptidase n=1 Tax=Raoultibacter phocaeensis TaxID=2479841 RepID=UPI001119C15D|nr:D-alanyl-D-alanine carboxypeptidase [Raoultibacter phocaeensis]